MSTTAAEQYLLELINDARLDPLGDAARYIVSYTPLKASQPDIQAALTYFGVSGTQLLAAFQALTPAPPLAASDLLTTGALAHDQAMIAAGQQSHQVPDEADLGTRIAAEGYPYVAAAENIYAYAQDMLFAQAAFMVDWGGTAATGGIQSPPGHRIDIMNPTYREVGVAVVSYSDPATGLGPNIVTEDFGTAGPQGSFLLGVAYTDLDHDGFYSIGEGVAGLKVSVGSQSITSGDSGGWTLATSLTGPQTVELTGGGLPGPVDLRLSMTDAAGNGLNTKVDVIDGTVLHVSASTTVSGPVTVVQALGILPVALADGDTTGRTLIANAGGDSLAGGTGDDTLIGGAGNDIIDGGNGSNALNGGGGTDTAVFDFAHANAIITAGPGVWYIDAAGVHDVVSGFSSYRFTDETLTTLTTFSADPLFDPVYYLTQNPDVAAAGVDPYQHYMTTGWMEGRNPDAFFDTTYYLTQNPDVAAAGINPLTHFETSGWKEGRNPSAAFSDSQYLAHNPDVAAAGIDPLVHYITNGQYEGRAAFPVAAPAPPADPLIDPAYIAAHDPQAAASGLDPVTWFDTIGWQQGANPDALFDTTYYLAQNPDVAAAHINPLAHFEASGWKEGRQPSLLFDDAKYLAANPDVAAAGIDPLAHYMTSGQNEGRMAFLTGPTLAPGASPDPLVNAAYYDAQLGATLIPPGAAGQAQAAASYDATGWQRGLDPDAFFDTSYYLTQNPDVAAAHIDALLHYETSGWHEGRNPSAAFDTRDYLTAYPDVAAAGIDPLLHYVQNGMAEGRSAFPV